MSFRMRMVLASLVVGVFAILAASFGAYFASRNALTNSADDVLVSAAGDVSGSAGTHPYPVNTETGAISGVPGVSAAQFYSQSLIQPQLPVTAAVKAVAAGSAHSFYTNVRVDGIEQREYVTFVTLRVSNGIFSQVESGALQVAISLTGVNEQLGHLGLALLLVALAALTLAAVLGWVVSRTAVGPLNDLTAAVEELARTTDVSERLEPGGADELGRLRRAFNRLLVALEASRESQHQLVVDASHELRTPLTSLRTNLEIVRRIEELSEPEREVLVADVLTQMQELTNLVGDLAELSRGQIARTRGDPLAPRSPGRGGGRACELPRATAGRDVHHPSPADLGPRKVRSDRPGRGQPARQRPQVEPRRGQRGGLVREWGRLGP